LNHAHQSNADFVALSDPLDVAAHPYMVPSFFFFSFFSAYYVIDDCLFCSVSIFLTLVCPNGRPKTKGPPMLDMKAFSVAINLTRRLATN
jgi:hypothetical protein